MINDELLKLADSYAAEGKRWLRDWPVVNTQLQELIREAYVAGAAVALKNN